MKEEKRLYPKAIILNKHNIGNQAVTHYFNFIFKGYQYNKGVSFDFLGYTFKPNKNLNRKSKQIFVSYDGAISKTSSSRITPRPGYAILLNFINMKIVIYSEYFSL